MVLKFNYAAHTVAALIVQKGKYSMEKVKSYQEKVQGSVEKAISAVENKHAKVAGFVYSKAHDVNNFIGKKSGELISKFEKPETKTAKVKKTAKKAATTAKKKATAAKAATSKATKAVVDKVEEATA